ncbi:MAG: sorbosone dehydrogenase [Bacteroidetes bacterium]|nr:sorbosone dehydrogenase [Bacteroidota bacterium]
MCIDFLFNHYSLFRKQENGNPGSDGLELPNDFGSQIVADDLGEGRHIVVNSNGDIYVSLRIIKNGGGVVGLRDADKDGIAEEIKYFGQFTGTGIGIHNGYLYVGADTIIVRYKLLENELVPDLNHEVIAGGFVRENQHETKSITFDNAGNLFVTVGAPSNACQDPDRTPGTPGLDPCPLLERYGGIWKFDANEQNQDQVRDGYRYATGIRNAVAVDWNKSVNGLFALQHGRDQLSQFWPDLYTDEDNAELPAEEFFRVNDGSDFGWPYCYYDHIQSKKLLNPEYGGDSKTEGRCKDKDQPIMAFPGHLAPNDLIFHTGKSFPEKYKNGAFITFHGSWNRAPKPQKGFFVAFVPFNGDLPSGNWEIFADNFAGATNIASPSDAKHRPCGIAEGPDGSLYIIDSVKGRIWNVFYQNKM